MDAAAPATRRPRLERDLVQWVVVGVLIALSLAYRRDVAWLAAYPAGWTLPVADWINAGMEVFVDVARPFFLAVAAVFDVPLTALQKALHWLPWPATLAAATILAHYAAGLPLAAFTAGSLFYMVVTGYWDESMNTLALVGVSVPLAVAVGFSLGTLGYRSPRVRRVLEPLLDLMQTVPTFAYLIPILLLFGFGPVVGLIASAIYATPPMVRNTMLGLYRVPHEVIESAQMSGASRLQVFWWVRVPTALPTIMVGVNQTLMASLSMVIIAAIIGGFADIGWEVLSTMRKAQFGQSLLAGLVIALMAMVMDRVSRGFTDQTRLLHATGGSAWQRHRHAWLALGGAAAATLAAGLVPALRAWPDAWVFYPAEPLNDAITWIIVEWAGALDGLKKAVLFFVLLPMRIGLEQTVRPFTWGFDLTPAITWGYAAGVAALAALAHWAWSWRPAVAVALGGTFVYFGITATPWPAFALVVILLAWQVGGWRIGLFAVLGLAFLLVTGMWEPAMRSVYLCGVAVIVSFALGGLVGIWAAHDDRVSAFVRPINDTLQTMPLFVFLIPILMFFQVGEFSALLAIVAYAIVPAIRYTEHGLRNVSHEIVEAGRAIGCTGRQLLWQVKLPMAVPEIMLGLNQTIMFGLAMLVIAALVGTKGLGQEVYIALGKANTGLGTIAGLGMAIIAMLADRIIQAWSAKKKAALGL